jgi:indolepyruvate ferredoxin oxidoreductase alpha subunit
VKDSGDPLKEDPVAAIDNSCVGCGNCGEVAEAAVLCPSFYRADIVHNPGGFERWLDRVRGKIIGALQRRRDARRLAVA